MRTFVTPIPGSGAVNLRSTAKIDPANIVGMINEGMRLEYVTQTDSWYVGRVYVSTLGAEAFGNQFIKPRASHDFVNIRSSPVVENNTDVGDLKQGQQLELIAKMGEWLVGKVHLSASWCELVTEGTPDIAVPIVDGFDAPIESPARFGGDPLTWQYFHFRAVETGLNEVPNRFKTLPAYIIEANPQMKADKLPGWEANNSKWIMECVDYVQTWNAAVGRSPRTAWSTIAGLTTSGGWTTNHRS